MVLLLRQRLSEDGGGGGGRGRGRGRGGGRGRVDDVGEVTAGDAEDGGSVREQDLEG